MSTASGRKKLKEDFQKKVAEGYKNLPPDPSPTFSKGQQFSVGNSAVKSASGGEKKDINFLPTNQAPLISKYKMLWSFYDNHLK